MARLPQPGGDSGNWGTILNDYLSVEHDGGGHLKPGVVGSTQLAGNAVTATHVADGALTQAKVQNLASDLAAKAPVATTYTKTEVDTALGAKYTKPGTGIPDTDLSTDVQNSLSLANTALQSVPPQTGVATLSGFPLRLAGEKQHSNPLELAKAYTAGANPSGAKRVVLAENWGTPGILKHIWMASSDGNSALSGFAEDGGIIRIYIDDQSSPAVSMKINDFFAYAPLAGTYSNRRMGRTKVGGGESSAYRYLYMPFKKYLCVEVENTSSNVVTFFGSADYTLINDFATIGTQQVNYKMHAVEDASAAPFSALTVVDAAGSGQVESLWLAVNAASGDTGVLEGNIEIYVDNATTPTWSSSGTEDAFNGGWYNVPIGGFPAGRAGDSTNGGLSATYYRFFIDDPIYYDTHIKIVIHAGQRNQGTITSGTVGISGFAGIWSNTPQPVNYQAVDTAAAAILDDQFTMSAGALSSTDWNQIGGKTAGQATGSSVTFAYDGAAAGEDTRAARKNVALPANYWVETRTRITDATHDGQDASLIALGNSPDPYFGSAIHLQLTRFNQYNWVIRVRDDFDEVFIRTIGSGRDLTNVWVKLAFKVVGTSVTAYWQPDGGTVWQTLGSWTTGKTGTAFGIGTWTAGAEFDYLVVRPLSTTNS